MLFKCKVSQYLRVRLRQGSILLLKNPPLKRGTGIGAYCIQMF